MRCKSSWGHWAADRACQVCVSWLLFSYDDSLTLRLTLTLTLALAICNCRTAELMFALLNISCDLRYLVYVCMFFPLCLLALADLNNFLRQPLILHRQLQFSIIFHGSRLSPSSSSWPPSQSQQQALLLLPLLLWLINCGHFVCAEIPPTDTWPAIKTLWARTQALGDALRKRFFSRNSNLI